MIRISVISSAAAEPAISGSTIKLRTGNRTPLCHPERSRGICSSVQAAKRRKATAARSSACEQWPRGNQPRHPTTSAVTCLLVFAAFALCLGSVRPAQAVEPGAGISILKAEDLAKLVPATVFFRGQVASVQARNAGGVKLADGMVVLAALVDTSGYSTAVQQKYQAYFITEVALTIEGQTLQPGAYGIGFVAGDHFLVMDVGAHDLITTTSHRDAALKRPTPLQILQDPTPNQFRLYVNRNYVVVSRASSQ